MNCRNLRILIICIGFFALVFGFQNCSPKIQMSDIQLAAGPFDKAQSADRTNGTSSTEIPNQTGSVNPASGEVGICRVICKGQFNQNSDKGFSGEQKAQHSDANVNESCGNVNELDGSNNDGQYADTVVKVSESASKYKTACMSRAACENLASSINSGSLKLPKENSSGNVPAVSTEFIPSSSGNCEAGLDDQQIEEVGQHGEIEGH